MNRPLYTVREGRLQGEVGESGFRGGSGKEGEMCEDGVTAKVCGPSLMQIAAIFLCLWLRFS